MIAAATIKEDARLTGIDEWLRKYCLDKLPQLMKVLNSNMSLVAPKPPIPSKIEEYNQRHEQRLAVKPVCCPVKNIALAVIARRCLT